MRKVCSPYNVNGVALDCLPVALADDGSYRRRHRSQVHRDVLRLHHHLPVGVEGPSDGFHRSGIRRMAARGTDDRAVRAANEEAGGATDDLTP